MRRSAVGLAILLSTAATAPARPLFRADAPRAFAAGSPRVRPLALDVEALVDLRGRAAAVLEEFPVGLGTAVTLDVHRVEPFSAGAVVEDVTASGPARLRLPDRVYFGGTVRGEPQSVALLVAGRESAHGFVVHGGTTYPFGPDADGAHRSYAVGDAAPASLVGPAEFCGNDLYRDALRLPAPRAAAAAPLVTAATSTLLEVEAAIETDQELRAKFASSSATLDYLTDLLAAANVIYERDAQVRLAFSYVRIWSTTDPWTATGTLAALNEVRGHWLNPANGMDGIAGPHDLVHMLSGKSVQGGIAYLDAVCEHDWAFGVSQVYGAFDVGDPYGIWDVEVFTHELGHNLGSDHTHCYSPPIDHCYSGEAPECYNGPESVPAGGGTIMSYCHLLPPGLSNIYLLFGDTVSNRIRATVESASCLTPVGSCGDGTLEGGEQCDDGNTSGGDGCSAGCALETTCGDGLKEGAEQCDDGNTSPGDGCSALCRLEVCGNGVLDPGEVCDDHNTAAGDGCSPTCAHEILCGDGLVEGSEECDDGNLASGDGCSAACLREPCTVVVPHQAAWSPVKLVMAGGRFALRARFGIPADLGALGVATDGLELLVDGGSGARELSVSVPGGARWTARRSRLRYRDPSGAAGGVRSIVIRTRERGVTAVDLKISSRGGPTPSADDLPPAVTVLLGNAAAGAAGACGHYNFTAGSCVRRGKRLVCR